MYFKQVEEIASGRKTCTQRVVKDGERAIHAGFAHTLPIDRVADANSRLKWQVGRDYAVSPGRGKPSAWWRFDPSYMSRPRIWHLDYPNEPSKIPPPDTFVGDWKPLRIRITAIERVPLHDMDERVALAEGVGSVAEYKALWRTINAAPGTRWEDCPLVWRLWFEVVR